MLRHLKIHIFGPLRMDRAPGQLTVVQRPRRRLGFWMPSFFQLAPTNHRWSQIDPSDSDAGGACELISVAFALPETGRFVQDLSLGD